MTVNSDVPKTLLELNEEYITRHNEAIHSKQQLAVKMASTPVEAVSWKTDRRMTAYPLFAPDKRNCYDIFEYISPDGNCRVKVFPDVEYGRAKVWDADVFNYFLSRAYAAYQQTEQIPSRIETSAYQVLKHLNKNPRSGKNNAWLRESIRRLSGTRYKTTIFQGTREAETGFHLIDYSFYNLEGSKAEKRETIGRIIIWFNVDLVACWLNDIKHILSLPNEVLEACLKEQNSGLRKRLLLLIGSRLGIQESIVLSLENLKGLCGYTRETKFFKAAFKEIIPSLPWRLEFSKQSQGKGENVIISQKTKLVL